MKINFVKIHQKLFDSLPGKSKKHFFLVEREEWANQTAISLEGIDKFFNETECPWDTIILTIEIWHYPDVEKIIAEHPQLQNKNVFVITLGYKNYQFGSKCWKLSFPWGNTEQFKIYKSFDNGYREHGLQYGFSSLNGRPAVHRILLGYFLHQQNLLDNLIFTQNIHDQIDAEIFNTLPEFDDYKKLLPISTVEHKDSLKWDMFGEFNHPAYNQAYCNIVTETETEIVPYQQNQNIEIVTEKSGKPFFTKQIPLFLAGQGHLSYLKYLGFEIMDDLTPAGYDQMRTLEKIAAIVDIVARGRDYIEDFYFSHLKEIQHNYELATSGTLEDKIVADIQQLING
jgi:hypothetical protein